MSSYLYRLGRRVTRHARLVLAGWLAVLVAAGALVAVAGGSLQEDLTIPGTESQEGLDVLERQFPRAAGTTGQLVFVAPPGDRIGQHRGEVRAVLQRVEAVDHVSLVSDPFAADNAEAISADGRHALAWVQLDVPLDGVDHELVDELTEAAEARTAPATGPGPRPEVLLGGSVFTTTTVHVSATEGVGVVVALVVLAMTLGSLLAAGLPILTAVLGVAVAMAGILVAAGVADISSSTPTLALMIGLAVGIDYALFIVSRHRDQLADGIEVEDSVARALATAGSAVIFAGATVVIALCALVVARIPFLAVMGYAAAAAVAIAVLVALTAVPALLALAGDRLRPRPRRRGAGRGRAARPDRPTLGRRWVALVTRAPLVTVALVVPALLLAAVPAKDLALGLPDNGTAQPGSTERVTYDTISDAYGAGWNTPLLVTVDIIRTTDPVGVMQRLGRDLAAVEGVQAVPLATPNPKADLGVVQVVPRWAQADPRTADLVERIRDQREQLERRHGITDLRVTGQTAVTIDVSERLAAALLPFAVVVVGLSLLLLTMVFRSVAVPVKATLGYLLSVAASFGAVAAVFEWGWFAEAANVTRTGPVISFLPILLMGVLFGLAMDYEVFLVSRMREEYVHTGDARRAAHDGFAASARVVTAAAVIMISVFAAFVPESDAIVKPIALGLAVGVFVDAFLVRMTLVPAVMAVLGERAWWLPRRLDRRLPTLDVEGAGLSAHLAHEEWVAERGPAAVRAERVTVRDRSGALLEPTSLVVRPGELVAVAGDPVSQRALLETLAGRLAPSGGTLVVHDRVLPGEQAAVRRGALLHDRLPDDVAARPGLLRLVAHVEPTDWDRLRRLAEAGETVIGGASVVPTGGVRVVRIGDPPDPATRPDRRELEVIS